MPPKPPSEYTYAERRAELLEQIRDLGHPSLIHRGKAADRYEVTPGQITRDLDRIADYVADSLDEKHDLGIEAVFKRSLRGLIEDEEWRKAAQTARDYDEWVRDRKQLAELEERIEKIEAGGSGRARWRTRSRVRVAGVIGRRRTAPTSLHRRVRVAALRSTAISN